jgi:Rieske Fe-S protein
MGKSDHSMITRREVIQAIGILTLLPVAGLWQAMVMRMNTRERVSEVQIPLDSVALGVSFGEGYLVFRDEDEIVVYSSRCTHLGCHLKSLVDGNPVCACHGSQFNPKNGSPKKGPAIKPLQKLDYYISDNNLIIKNI